jgi:hypothetical protein
MDRWASIPGAPESEKQPAECEVAEHSSCTPQKHAPRAHTLRGWPARREHYIPDSGALHRTLSLCFTRATPHLEPQERAHWITRPPAVCHCHARVPLDNPLLHTADLQNCDRQDHSPLYLSNAQTQLHAFLWHSHGILVALLCHSCKAPLLEFVVQLMNVFKGMDGRHCVQFMLQGNHSSISQTQAIVVSTV